MNAKTGEKTVLIRNCSNLYYFNSRLYLYILVIHVEVSFSKLVEISSRNSIMIYQTIIL